MSDYSMSRASHAVEVTPTHDLVTVLKHFSDFSGIKPTGSILWPGFFLNRLIWGQTSEVWIVEVEGCPLRPETRQGPHHGTDHALDKK